MNFLSAMNHLSAMNCLLYLLLLISLSQIYYLTIVPNIYSKASDSRASLPLAAKYLSILQT
jgi:hypothetical protein